MKIQSFRRVLGSLAATTILTLASTSAQAAGDEQFPSRSIRVLVGFSAGGGADKVVRVMAPVLSRELKQNIVIENRPGAGGNIASEELVRTEPDGYTIMLGTIGSLSVNQHLTKLSYDPIADMEPIAMAVSFSNVLVVRSDSKIHTLADYVKAAQAPHSNVPFGSGGIGSSGHLGGELLKSMAGLNNQHVAYRGGAPAMTDLIGGTVASVFSNPSDAVPFIAVGKLRALAATGLKRMSVLPNVPTIAESGYPGFEANNWYAFTAPANTPKAVIDTLNKAIVTAMKDPDVDKTLKQLGLDPAPSTPEEADRYIRAESKKWGDLVKKIGISTH